MRIFVTGPSRCGTTLVREVVIGLKIAQFHCSGANKEEDRSFFLYKELPENYMTKLPVPHSSNITSGYTLENFIKYMKRYKDLHAIFSFRHPVDACMSKIVRGQKASRGGDREFEKRSPDSYVPTAISAVKFATSIYKEFKKIFPGRLLAVKMEHLILSPDAEVKRIADFLGAEVTKESLLFYKYNSNVYQYMRYGSKLDTSQIDVYERWQTAYGGFFKNREDDIKKLKEAFKNWVHPGPNIPYREMKE